METKTKVLIGVGLAAASVGAIFLVRHLNKKNKTDNPKSDKDTKSLIKGEKLDKKSSVEGSETEVARIKGATQGFNLWKVFNKEGDKSYEVIFFVNPETKIFPSITKNGKVTIDTTKPAIFKKALQSKSLPLFNKGLKDKFLVLLDDGSKYGKYYVVDRKQLMVRRDVPSDKGGTVPVIVDGDHFVKDFLNYKEV